MATGRQRAGNKPKAQFDRPGMNTILYGNNKAPAFRDGFPDQRIASMCDSISYSRFVSCPLYRNIFMLTGFVYPCIYSAKLHIVYVQDAVYVLI